MKEASIREITVFWEKAFSSELPDRPRPGSQILTLRRRGKYIVMDLAEGAVLIHLRMTGRLTLQEPAVEEKKYVTVALHFSDHRTLWFHDMRKFGRVCWVRNANTALGHLGPEPLASTFTARKFAEMLGERRGRIKPLLLNQTFLAGIGNIYADEALYMAGIHPLRPASGLSSREIRTLHRAIRKLLRDSIRHQGTTVLNFIHGDNERGSFQAKLQVYGRVGKTCPRCKSILERLVIAQRGTCFCPQCQPISGIAGGEPSSGIA